MLTITLKKYFIHVILIFFVLIYHIGTSKQNRRLNVARNTNNNLNNQYQTVIDSVEQIIRALSNRNSADFRALLNNPNPSPNRQSRLDRDASLLEQAFPHWMESLDGIFTTDFFFNGVRDATARALFSLDDNDNVVFLGIGNTHFNSLVK